MRKIVILLISLMLTFASCSAKTEITGENNLDVKSESVKTDSMKNITIVTENYPPLSFLDENGKVQGTSAEPVKKALVKLGIDENVIKVYSWAKSYDMASKDANTFIFNIMRTPNREFKFKWVSKLDSQDVYFYKLKSNNVKISSLEDAKKYKIATRFEDFTEQVLMSKGFEQLVSSKDHETCIKQLLSNKTELWISSIPEKEIKSLTDSSNEIEIAYVAKEIPAEGYLAASLNTPDEIVNKFKEAMSK